MTVYLLPSIFDNRMRAYYTLCSVASQLSALFWISIGLKGPGKFNELFTKEHHHA